MEIRSFHFLIANKEAQAHGKDREVIVAIGRLHSVCGMTSQVELHRLDTECMQDYS